MLERDLRSFVGVVNDSRDGLTRCFLFVMKLPKKKIGPGWLSGCAYQDGLRV